MIDRSHELPLTGQAKALGISRGSVYYLARPTSDADLVLMRRIDELHLEHPFAGSRMLRDMLKAEGREVGRRHVATLMKKMGVEAIYRRPNTSKPGPGHKIYPYLLRNLAVTRPNQVWAADITYVPMARGFVYLVAIVDWFSRKVLAWRLSITLSADFCIDALEEALARHRREVRGIAPVAQREVDVRERHLLHHALQFRVCVLYLVVRPVGVGIAVVVERVAGGPVVAAGRVVSERGKRARFASGGRGEIRRQFAGGGRRPDEDGEQRRATASQPPLDALTQRIEIRAGRLQHEHAA